MTTTLDQDDETKIQELLLGRRIVSAEAGCFPLPDDVWGDAATGKLTLDDGTVVYVAPNQGGCACDAGDYELEHLASVDNVITDVRLARENGDSWDDPTSYRIYVVADAVEINAVQVDGDDGNGYYGTGYELFVVKETGK